MVSVEQAHHICRRHTLTVGNRFEYVMGVPAWAAYRLANS